MGIYRCNVMKPCLEKLDNKIKIFKDEYGTDAVLFMNYNTEGDLEELGLIEKDFYKDDEGCAGKYKGCKIFYNSDMKYGEIEIR